jgi:hypothetical protein
MDVSASIPPTAFLRRRLRVGLISNTWGQAHTRSWLRPWRCTCGRPLPCPAAALLREEQTRLAARAAVDWYPRYFAEHGEVEDRTRVPRRGWWSA